MGVEYELKFRATEEVLAEICQAVDGASETITMQTTYYDTPTGQLSARKFTLRRRLENGRSVCTLKVPGKGAGRGEWETECDKIEDAIEKLCKLSCPGELKELTAEGLLPICGARFTRIAKAVILPQCTLELALDQGVLTGGKREAPLCEVEVELKEGSRQACDTYARALAHRFGLEAEPYSKFRRALTLYMMR